jgi:IS30 family transposase
MAKAALITETEVNRIRELFEREKSVRGVAKIVKRDPGTIRKALGRKKVAKVINGCFDWKDFNNSVIL